MFTELLNPTPEQASAVSMYERSGKSLGHTDQVRNCSNRDKRIPPQTVYRQGDKG